MSLPNSAACETLSETASLTSMIVPSVSRTSIVHLNPKAATIATTDASGAMQIPRIPAFTGTLSVYSGKGMFKEYLKKYYNSSVHTILQSFPDKKIRTLDKFLNFSPSLFYIVNRTLRNPDSAVWKLLSKKLYK